MGKIFLYSRVSTLDQNLTAQTEALTSAYPEGLLYEEKASGTTRKNRPELAAILKVIGIEDTLVVFKLDRLARSVKDLLDIVDQLEGVGATIKVLDQSVDTSTASGRAFVQMLAVFSEFETNIRRERQKVGIDKAKSEGKFKGKQVDQKKHDKAIEFLKKGESIRDVMAVSGLSRPTIYRIKKKMAL
ncbi:recombinase family protein [Maridesulfovibrio sp.]|uniref:recombinase family protein n=1 Tax=Maridesulfovibrio sp. TaxID=2795000 RepID=UPI0039F0E791